MHFVIMDDIEQRRKYFGDCSRRHQMRLIRQHMKSLFNTNASTRARDLSLLDTRENLSDENIVNISNFESKSGNNSIEETMGIIENMQLGEMDDNALPGDSNACNPAESHECEYGCLNENNLNGDISSSEESVDYLLEDDLCEWARRNKSVTHKAIDNLLKVLLKNFPGCGLPKTAKTLLGTTQMTNTVPIQGGEYVHMGLGPVLTAYMDEYSQAKLTVYLYQGHQLNVDGQF
ncbi:hypothetical protein PV326_009196 [Microctonus aethiopoides]|nr:hypothetical protein PV326_009196 [Microctonus aethiopoides]